MLQNIIDWVISVMEAIGSPGVGLAVFLENVFPPIPSEVILPLAGFTASQGSINVVAAFIWATVGSLTGAYFLYYLGAAIGANRLRKIAAWMWLVKVEDVDNALAWFDKYGKASILIGRVIPGIRSLISIPAGIDRMNPLTFGLYTLLGSSIWNALLIYCGWVLGENWHAVEGVIDQYSKVVYALVALALVAVFIWLLRRARQEKRDVA
ncbi:MAG: DedA family protein [Rothia sp. (in: high G+C Gram-positive bacteria)]|uniref:DedA family protein n=1 Tax=Rothia sp. (in: high G+C Gram-positive bacteria) TaxID=1885016 RepID=UPI002702DAAF|nr:DedA family protein [Rothia sp. (in: high G+C Gram-positive bacteria)]